MPRQAMHCVFCKRYFCTLLVVILFIRGLTCKPASSGAWQQCSGRNYFIGTKSFDIYSTYPFCTNLKSQLADFGKSPTVFARNICRLNLIDKRPYWIGSSVGQKQTDCTKLQQIGSKFKVTIVSCRSSAYPICERITPSTTTLRPTVPTVPTIQTAVHANWQRCNTKCYYLGKGNVTFSGLGSYCRSMSSTSKPVDFGTTTNTTLATVTSTCRLNISHSDYYWINRYTNNLLNHSDPDCRKAMFSGPTVKFKTTACTSKASPFCETDDTSFCKAQNRTTGLTKDWFRVGGQGHPYKLSSDAYTYCSALFYCTNQLQAIIAENGTYIFMGFLGSELGLSGLQDLFFWIKSPGISCPSRTKDEGLVMHYIGPMVHSVQPKAVSVKMRVLCVQNRNLTTIKTTTIRKTRTPMTPPTTQPTTTTTTTPTTTTPAPTTSKPTTPAPTTPKPTTPAPTTPAPTTSKPTTPAPTTPKPMTPAPTTPKPTTPKPMTPAPTTPKPTTPAPTTPKPTTPAPTTPAPTTPKPTTPAPKTPAPTTPKPTTPAPTTPAPTTPAPTTPTTTTPAPTTPKPTTPAPTTQAPTTPKPTTPAPKTPAPTTPKPTTPAPTTPVPTTPKPTTRTPPTTTPTTTTTTTTLPSTATTTTVPPQPPITTTTTPSLPTNVSGSTWFRIGHEEYYVNYDRTNYRNAEKFCQEALNASLVMFLSPIMYFTVLSQLPLQNNSFWVGAHGRDQLGFTDDCLSYFVNNLTMTTSPCPDPRFSICSRIVDGDLSQVLEDPEFREMIREMTVIKNSTQQSKRKLKCAEDRRPSAKAAGGVGVFIICSVVTLLLISDCSGIKSNFFNKNKKANENH